MRLRIPKKINQTWKTDVIPDIFRPDWVDSWRLQNTDWEIQLWTDADMDTWVRENYAEFYEKVFSKYDVPIKKIDAWRYLLLKKEGGWYVDLDMACLQPLESFQRDADIILSYDIMQRVTCSIMASIPNHAFWDGIEEALHSSMNETVLWATGPDFLSMYHERQCVKPTPLANRFLQPLGWSDSWDYSDKPLDELRKKFPEAIAVEFFTITWMGGRCPWEHIYANNAWGNVGSGPGSTIEATTFYRKLIEIIATKYKINSVLDIGCGDGRVAGAINWRGADYTGFDISGIAITQAHARNKGGSLKFIRGDSREFNFTNYEPDLILIKDVLQHLSNDSIRMLLTNLPTCAILVITNDEPDAENWREDIKDGEYRAIIPPEGMHHSWCWSGSLRKVTTVIMTEVEVDALS